MINRAWSSVILTIYLTMFFSTSASAGGTIQTAGDYLQYIVPAVAYGSTFYMDDATGRMQFYKSFLTNFAVTQGLKRTIDKKRPGGSGMGFPSGHTSAAFQGAAFIHERYSWKYSIPAYAAATFVGYSRVQSDKHFVIDVVAGAALGMATSFFFTEPYDGVNVTPVVNEDYYGVSISSVW